MAFPTNIALGRKGLQGMDTLDYYELIKYGCKRFITLGYRQYIGWKGLQGTNTPTYYELINYGCNFFITLGHGFAHKHFIWLERPAG
jgi:hypothetical protein